MSDLSLTVSAMRRLGYDDAKILELVEAIEAERRAAAREKNAARQKAFRARNANNADNAVTRDSVTTPAPYKETTRAQTVIPAVSSLRSETDLVSPCRPPAAPRKASRAKPRTAIAEDQLPAEADVEAAKTAGLDRAAMISEWQKFRNHHRAKGSLMADWSAAWRTWLGNMAQFQPRSRAGPAYRDNRNGFGQIAAELWGDEIGRTAQNHHETDGWLSIGHGAIEGERGGDPRSDHRDNGVVLDLDPF